MIKLCYLNQDNPHFSLFEHHSELAACCKGTDPSLLKLSRFEPTGLAHLDCHVWGAMLEKCHKLQQKPTTTDELKATLQTIWEKLREEHVNKAVVNFAKRLTCLYMAMAANGGQ